MGFSGVKDELNLADLIAGAATGSKGHGRPSPCYFTRPVSRWLSRAFWVPRQGAWPCLIRVLSQLNFLVCHTWKESFFPWLRPEFCSVRTLHKFLNLCIGSAGHHIWRQRDDDHDEVSRHGASHPELFPRLIGLLRILIRHSDAWCVTCCLMISSMILINEKWRQLFLVSVVTPGLWMSSIPENKKIKVWAQVRVWTHR